MAKRIVINGNKIHDITSLYEEINQVFMANEDWKIGENLDALNDMFYGSFGVINGNEAIELVWENYRENKKKLGYELTKSYYLNKLNSPSVYNVNFVKEKLAELENGSGKTYFEIILEIISEHPNIKLILQ